MMENFLIALEIMGKGMGGIFVSILIIMGCVVTVSYTQLRAHET